MAGFLFFGGDDVFGLPYQAKRSVPHGGQRRAHAISAATKADVPASFIARAAKQSGIGKQAWMASAQGRLAMTRQLRLRDHGCDAVASASRTHRRAFRFTCQIARREIARRHASSLSRRIAPEFVQEFTALIKHKGAGKAGRWPRPWPPCEQKARGRNHRSGRHTRPPLRDGFTIYTRSPRGPALLPPSPASSSHRKLDLSTGRPGPRDFTVASDTSVRASKPTLRPDAPTASRTRRP
jgi:hypothetical protein